jgi:acetoin utilization protein AcuB
MPRLKPGWASMGCLKEGPMPGGYVRELMTHEPVTLKETAMLREAVELVMVRRIRHIPVLGEDGRLVGIVTDRDVKRSLPSPLSAIASEEYEMILDETPLTRVMTREPQTIDVGARVADAVDAMISAKVGGLPVVSEGRLVGIFTERDALKGYLALLKRLGAASGEPA